MPFTLALEQAAFSVFPLNCQGSIGELREDKNCKATEILPARAAQHVLSLRHFFPSVPTFTYKEEKRGPTRIPFHPSFPLPHLQC